MDPVVATFVILGLAVVAFVTDRVPVPVVAVGVALALWATGVLDLDQAVAGFGDPTVLFIASLFVVSEALDATGVTAWAAQQVVGRAGRGEKALLVFIMLLVAALTALISVNGSVAALIPVVVVVATRVGLAPSRLLLPLAFAAHAGSMLALTGTPVNIIVSEAAESAAGRRFGYAEFSLVGIPLVVGTLLITMLAGRRLVPERTPSTITRDLSDHARTLRDHYDLDTGELPVIDGREGIVEGVVPPRSRLLGEHIFPGMMIADGEFVVLAVRRHGEDLEGRDRTLGVGDSLLLRGDWAALERYTSSRDVLVVDRPSHVRRAVPLGAGAKRSAAILAGMVALLASGLVPPAAAAMIAAVAVVLSRALSVTQAFRGISWTTVVLVAGMIPLSTAFTTTGAAQLLADALTGMVGDLGPHVALLIICLATMILGQFISNAATVLIMIPVAVAVAADFGVSALPFLMALTVSGAAAFITPVATPANLMIYEPGGLRFGDYWRLGLPLMLFFLVMAVFYVPLVWRF